MNYLNSISSRKIKQFIIDKALVLVLIFMILFMVIIEPTFLQWRVIKDILTQSSVKLIVALGLLFSCMALRPPLALSHLKTLLYIYIP